MGLQGKKIILGISGSIASYKAAYLTRLLVKAGAEVRVLMTPASTEFISPLTLSTLSKNDVLSAVLDEQGWNNHVELGLWADAYIIAPATANTMAKMAHGICDTILHAVYLSARCPVLVAPAMDVDMWLHPSTQRNLNILSQDQVHIIPVEEGELASGLIGKGRMAEPEQIVQVLMDHLSPSPPPVLAGKKVLITAGPTYEPIDPVRFIGNHSSGKMGLALAEVFAEAGAQVKLVLGPSALDLPGHSRIQVDRVRTAEEMLAQSLKHYKGADCTIFAAAVADYRPANVAPEKIKKSASTMELTLVRNPDIAKELGAQKSARQVHIGFALETEKPLENGRKKLTGKNFDLIVVNSLKDEGAGFKTNTNKITILDRHNNLKRFELKPKSEVAKDILQAYLQFISE